MEEPNIDSSNICDDDDDDLSEFNFDSSMDTVSICETLFDCCQDSQQLQVTALANYCNDNSIELNHVLVLLDSYLFSQKYLSYSFFNFDSFLAFCQTVCSEENGIKITGHMFFTNCWNQNHDFQCDFIKYCIDNNKIAIIFETCDDIKLNKEVSDWIKCFHDSAENLLCWKYYALFKVFSELSKKDKLCQKLENIFKDLCEKCPDLLIFGLLEVGFFETNVIRTLMIKAIQLVIYPASNTSYHNNATFIIQKLWSNSAINSLNSTQILLIDSMVQLYNNSSNDDQTNKLLRILEITQDLKALNYMLNVDSYLFVIDLASVASRREYLKLDKWINDKMSSIGDPFAEACKYYVKHKLWKVENSSQTTKPSHVETLNIILSCLENYFSNVKTSYSGDMKDVFKIYEELESTAQLANINLELVDDATQNKTSNLLDSNIFAQDVQMKADAYLKRIFSQYPIDSKIFEKILDFFEKLKKSIDKQENDIFECMIQTLVKELDYLFRYQEHQLSIMAELISGIINRNIVESNLFSFILQKIYFIINSSKNDTNLLLFSTHILKKCQAKLQQYPMLYEKLLKIDLPKITNASHSEVKKNSNYSANIFTKDSYGQDTESKERLIFAFNNLDGNNVNTISCQFKEDCKNQQFMELLTDCLTCRAINQANHHKLFYQLLELIDSTNLIELVTKKTYDKIRDFLLKVEYDDHRKKLYSAGQWLGRITLQRDKPILSIYLDIHSLLNEAECKGLLIYIVPFVVRILNSCALSKVFRPPNPWLMYLIRRLIEIYQIPDSKLKIKFEIENLFKILELNLNEYISDVDKYRASKRTILEEYLKGPSILQVHSQTEPESTCPTNNIQTLFEKLLEKIRLSLQIKSIQSHPELIEQIKVNIVKSTEECITGFSEKFVKILNSVEMLIKKDFALETDPRVMKKAAVNLTNFVSAGFTLINCKESLPRIMAENLRQLFFQQCSSISEYSKKFIHETVMTIVDDNIDLCISFIQKQFIDHAVKEILNRIQIDLEKRLKANSNGQKYIDHGAFHTLPITNLLTTKLKIYIPETNIYDSLNVSPLTNDQIMNSNHQEFQHEIIPYNHCQSIQINLNEDEHIVENNNNIPDFIDRESLKVTQIFKEWIEFFHGLPNNYQNIHNELFKTSYFKNEESLYSFFKTCFEFCYEKCQQISETNKSSVFLMHYHCFSLLDAFVYLVLFLIKYESIEFKLNVLDRVMTDLSTHVHGLQKKNVDLFAIPFQPLCYYRVIVLFYLEFINEIYNISHSRHRSHYSNSNIISNESLKLPLMQIFYDFLKSMSPLNTPWFTFAWLEFISHRSFIGNCLGDGAPRKLWKLYFNLLRDLLEFQNSFFQNDEFKINEIKSDSFKVMHKGTIKLFLLLLHDFPDFLCHYCFLICDNLPPNAFQFRNIVLSAFPNGMNLPYPLQADLTLDNFNEIINEFDGEFSAESPFKPYIDIYFKTGKLFHLKKLPPYFESAKSLQVQIEYINKILYSISDHIIKENRNIDYVNLSKEPSLEMIKCLLEFFDVQRTYFLFNAMVNHLRYPNIETKYFTCLLLYFFQEHAPFKDIILRVIVERSLAPGPHPWGLLYIRRELINNPVYNFQEYIASMDYELQRIFQKLCL